MEKQHEFNHPGPEELVLLDQRDLLVLDQRDLLILDLDDVVSWTRRTGGSRPEELVILDQWICLSWTRGIC